MPDLPQVNTVILGGFQIVDITLAENDSENPISHSHVDLVFGKEGSQFSGAQRFSVTRSRLKLGQETVQIQFESLACNPSVNRLGFLKYLGWFHDVYAELLFRETVACVMKGFQTDRADWGYKLLGLVW